MKPQVTIIMATYNRAHFIVETLLSIQNQTFNNFECIIIDDGGTDNTLEVIKPILENDKRFQFFKRNFNYQKGLPGCRNYGIDLAKGDYIIFFDDDDIVHPQNLELCVHELSKDNVSFCRYDRKVFVDKFHYEFELSKDYSYFNIDVKDIEALLKNELPFNSCAVMWKATCFKENRFIEHLMYAEEWELYSRLLSTGIKGVSINKTLFYGRKHPNSNTGEFYADNPIRRDSYSEAILLVFKNLNKKQLLSYSIKRYLFALSLEFKEFNLFSKVLININISNLEKSFWKIFYFILPYRLMLYRYKKKVLQRNF